MPTDADLPDTAVALLVAAARFSRLAARETPAPLPHALWRMMSQLEELGPVRVGELARADRCSQPTATAMVARLLEQGWVDRHVDPDDGRAVRVQLSDAGRAELAAQRRAAGNALAPRLAALSPAEVAALRAGIAVLRRLTDPAPAGSPPTDAAPVETPATSPPPADARPFDATPPHHPRIEEYA